MLWRRGGGRYRPLVPVNLALEELELLDFEEWEDLELPETHFDWDVPVPEDAGAQAKRIANVANELWAVAGVRTRAKGPVCDFQLRGYGSDDHIHRRVGADRTGQRRARPAGAGLVRCASALARYQCGGGARINLRSPGRTLCPSG